MASGAQTKTKQNRNLELNVCFTLTHLTKHLNCFHNEMISVCRLLNVSNAWYADCNGLYSLTNLTAVWDKKRVVYMRIHGGINPADRRFVLTFVPNQMIIVAL